MQHFVRKLFGGLVALCLTVAAAGLMNTAPAMAQSTMIQTTSTEQATTATISPVPTKAIQPSSLLTRIGAFPALVLSTVNTIVTQAQISAAALALDSSARTDNVALQLGLLNSSRAGFGAKYWLTEHTALQVDVSTGVNLGVEAITELGWRTTQNKRTT